MEKTEEIECIYLSTAEDGSDIYFDQVGKNGVTKIEKVSYSIGGLMNLFLPLLLIGLLTPSYAWEVAQKEQTTSHAENKLIVKFYKDPVRAHQEAQEHGCTAFSRKDESGAVVICGRTVNSTLIIAGLSERPGE
jgi:hypothetical protein